MPVRHAAPCALLVIVTVLATAAATAAQDIAARLDGASAQQGEMAFLTCGACHTVERGGAVRVGPNLWGVVGAPVAAREGFDYSEALRSVGGTWTFQRLDEFLRAPMDFAPGTRMVYPGVDDPMARASIIEWLRTRSDSPVAKPETAAGAAPQAASDPFGSDWPEGPGRDLTGFTCRACHSLAIVKQQGLPRERWDELLHWMVDEQGMEPLEPEQRDLVLDYLGTHFGIDR